MRLFADECVYAKTVIFLRDKGHHVKTVHGEGLSGSNDLEVIQYSIENDFVLLTRDKDFKDILKYPPSRHKGVIILEINPRNTEEVHYTLTKMLGSHEDLNKTLVIVDRQKYKLTKMQSE